MPARTVRIFKLRLHKPFGQGVVTIKGRDFYLGPYGSEACLAEYKRLIAELLTSGRWVDSPAKGPGSSDLTFNELILTYVGHADVYYRKNGKPTTEPANIKLALRPLRQMYGHTIVKDFGPLSLKAVRGSMIKADLCRAEVNKRIRHIVRMIRWGVENELVPPSIHHGLKAVPGLKRGRSEARESEPVKPVPDAFVDAIEPHVAKQIWAMVQLQRLTGQRPGEVTTIRKSPMTPSQRARRRVPKRKRQPGDDYTSESYCRTIKAACKRAGVPHWHPHQLRHNAATYLRKEFGSDVARVILGHSSSSVTEIYAEIDHAKAISVMEQVG